MIEPDEHLRKQVRAHLMEQVDYSTPRRVRTAHGATRTRPLTQHRESLRVALVTATVAAAILATCAGIALIATHRGAPTPAQSRRTAEPIRAAPQTDAVATAIHGVRGTGTLRGPVTGTFTISSDYTLQLRDLNFHGSLARSVQLATSTSAVGCNNIGIDIVAGTITSSTNQDIVLAYDTSSTLTDPSYWSTFAIVPDAARNDSCTSATYTISTVHWQIPKAIRDLANHDNGPTAGAHGTTSTQGGRPNRYTVTADDTITAVAARFGMTADDLLYLNPLRRRGTDTTLYDGEQLNLNPLDRAWFWR